MKRYRVKAPHKSWRDSGPDLLRKRPDAEKALTKLLPIGSRHWRMRIRRDGSWGEWSRPMSRRKILRRVHRWEVSPTDQMIHLGQGPATDVAVKAEMKVERVEWVNLTNGSNATEATWSLIHHQFDNVVFAGAYVYKETVHRPDVHPNGCHWSDHSYNPADAVDGTPRGRGVQNDGLTEWCARMSRTGNMPVNGYILGSRRGEVVVARPSRFRIRPGSGSSSHLWHVHISTQDNGGRFPGPRQG